MAKPKRYRWVCPNCGLGALGSSRPRRNATVRFCLPCSADSPVMIERCVPVLDRHRSANMATKDRRRKAKATKAREKETARWTFDGLDLRPEIRQLCKRLKIREPGVTLRIRRRGTHTTGHSYGGRIALTIPTRASAGAALALVCHELAHEAEFHAGDWHGQRWRSRFVELVESYGARPEGGESRFALHCSCEAALDVIFNERFATSQNEEA